MQLPSPSPSHDALRFGRFELQRSERRLLFDSRPVMLGARAFDLLVALADRRGELVGKNELLDRVWPGLVVEEGNIAVQVNALRKVLGGDLIGTVPGRGYCFTARVEGQVLEAPAMAVPAPDLQTRLPRVLPALLGRSGDLATLGALVDGHALVSVTGAGGIGKTLLVQHLLDARRRAHRHGVCWVELAGVTEAAALPATVAEALGVRLGGGDPFAALALAVGPLDLLLALDNAEHLRDDVGRLAALLIDAAPALKLVVTSQVRLGLATERVLRLSTLDLPPAGAGVEQALASGAVALFVDRAQAADARFALTDANVASVVSVCRSVDGLALAIELAAARAPMLGIHGLASSMGDRLQLLTRNRNRAAPPRQQTLRATLEWSHGFLDATEQAVFRRLAVVVGSCSLQLAQQIAADAAGARADRRLGGARCARRAGRPLAARGAAGRRRRQPALSAARIAEGLGTGTVGRRGGARGDAAAPGTRGLGPVRRSLGRILVRQDHDRPIAALARARSRQRPRRARLGALPRLGALADLRGLATGIAARTDWRAAGARRCL